MRDIEKVGKFLLNKGEGKYALAMPEAFRILTVHVEGGEAYLYATCTLGEGLNPAMKTWFQNVYTGMDAPEDDGAVYAGSFWEESAGRMVHVFWLAEYEEEGDD